MSTTIFPEDETLIQPELGAQGEGDSLLVSRLAALQTMNVKLMVMTDAGNIYEEMVRSAKMILGCDSCVMFVFEPDENVLHLQASSGYSGAARQGDISLEKSGSIQAQAFQEEYLVYVPDLWDNPEELRLDPDLRSELVIPISCKEGPAGLFDFGSREAHAFTDQEIRLCSMLVDQMAISLDNFRLLADLTASRDAVIRGMALLAESRDSHIGRHLDRICAFSRLLSERITRGSLYKDMVDEEFLETLARSAALHDIGKVGIPDHILLKPGKLSPDEFEIMKTHTTIGVSLMEELMQSHGSFPMLKMGAEVAIGHHEWWDGTGYPHRLKAEAIPLPARIVAICDVYDALISKRVYKEAWEQSEALRVIRERAGIQFDPHLAELFVGLRLQLREIHEHYSD